MMKLTVNFLSQHRKNLTEVEKKDKRFYQYSLFGSIGIAVVACVIVAISVGLAFFTNQVQAQQKELESSILRQQDVERSALILIAKLQSLQELIGQRRDKRQAITYFTNLLSSESVLVRDIHYLSGDGVLSLRLESENIFVFERLVEALSNEETASRFSKVVWSNIGRVRTGAYSINVTITLPTDYDFSGDSTPSE